MCTYVTTSDHKWTEKKGKLILDLFSAIAVIKTGFDFNPRREILLYKLFLEIRRTAYSRGN